MKTKNTYQQMLRTYLARREAVRANYICWKKSKEYVYRTESLNRRIDYCRQQIKRIEKRDSKIKALATEVCEFFDIPLAHCAAHPLKNSIKSTDKRMVLARMIFYKYAMENNIQGVFISQWVGAKWTATASEGRLRFTRSFQNNPENKRIWDHFKLYLKSIREGGVDILMEAA
jgi:hypothetical protein